MSNLLSAVYKINFSRFFLFGGGRGRGEEIFPKYCKTFSQKFRKNFGKISGPQNFNKTATLAKTFLYQSTKMFCFQQPLAVLDRTDLKVCNV